MWCIAKRKWSHRSTETGDSFYKAQNTGMRRQRRLCPKEIASYCDSERLNYALHNSLNWVRQEYLHFGGEIKQNRQKLNSEKFAVLASRWLFQRPSSRSSNLQLTYNSCRQVKELLKMKVGWPSDYSKWVFCGFARFPASFMIPGTST